MTSTTGEEAAEIAAADDVEAVSVKDVKVISSFWMTSRGGS